MAFTARYAALAAVVTLTLTVTGCTAGASNQGGGGGGSTLTLGQLVEPTSWDPAQAQEGYYMVYYQAVYDSLILREPDGSFGPMLATEWNYNDDNTVLTVDLRDGVTFSDGAAFDAAAAKANLDHFKSASGPQGSTLGNVSEVDVVDDDTITINLSAPDPALITYLSNAAGLMASPTALTSPDLATKPVGSGPYVLDASGTTVGSRYRFTKRDGYWNTDLQHYDTIDVKYIADVTARFNALVSGQVEAAPLDAKTSAQADAAGLVENAQPLDWRGLIIADRDGTIVPALADPRVRQAMTYALNGAGILKTIDGDRGEVTNQIFGTKSTAYNPEYDTVYAYDPAKAKELLAEAGYANGFSFDMPTIDALDPSLWPVMQQQLAEVGITVNLVPVPSADYISEITSKKFPVFFMGLFQPSTWVTVNQAVSPTALFNPFGNQRPELDGLITAVQDAPDDDAQVEPAQALNTYLVEQAWFAPLYRPAQEIYSTDSVKVELQTQQAYPSIYNFSPAQ